MIVPVKDSFSMLRPPIDRTMRVLERSFFKQKFALAAARIFDNSNIHPLRKKLGEDVLQADRISSVRPSPILEDVPLTRKAILLRPDIKADEPETWSSTLSQLVEQKILAVTPFELVLDYDYWNYDDIMQSILPEDEQHEIPSGFALVGHVAHLNLRSQYLQYKHIIAEVLLDKNPAVRTVINKIDNVGDESEFRTFSYELLKGDPSLQVEIKEDHCVFRFDYSKVYWNPRLSTEHNLLAESFKPGEAVCDVMAGVGPFAVPAAKRKVFVWANDLNPASYEAMVDATERNKVGDYLKAENMDGRQFIRWSAKKLLEEKLVVEERIKISRSARDSRSKSPRQQPQPKKYIRPAVFNHYVMNLPATATQFLDAFVGLYAGQESLFKPAVGNQLPIIHVYCFSTKSEDNKREEVEICKELSSRLGHQMEVGRNELVIREVRDVAPNKRMFCASFRLPEEVAFRTT